MWELLTMRVNVNILKSPNDNVTTSRSLEWNDTYSNIGDDATNQEEFVWGIQMAFFGIAFIMFIMMVCTSLSSRPSPRRPASSPATAQLAKEDRMKLVANSLVVKHVIGREPTTIELSEGPCDTKYASSFEQARNDMDQDDPMVPSMQKQASCTSISQSIRRTKSNLILSNAIDQELNADSSSGPTCAICLTAYEIGDEICWSPNSQCQHVFHHECIAQWLYKHDDCPMCRANFFLGQNLQPSLTEPVQRNSMIGSSYNDNDNNNTPPVDVEAPFVADTAGVSALNESSNDDSVHIGMPLEIR